MAKRSYKKNAKPEVEQINTASQSSASNTTTFIETYKVHIVLFVFAFLLYANTMYNQYASDDTLVYTSNTFTQKGISGLKEIFTNDAFVGYFGERGKTLVAGGRYRPLSMATFAIEVSVFGKNKPAISHAINALLFACTVWIIFSLLTELFSAYKQDAVWYVSIPFLTALLYASHPIHTEAVANIKGRDEIMGMLFSMWAVYYAVRYVKQNDIRTLLIFSVLLFLALLSKENAVTMIGVIFITYYVFTQAQKSDYFRIGIAYTIPTAIFLLLRSSFTASGFSKFTKELMNDPFVTSTTIQKMGTLFYSYATYLKLHVVPYPLTHDYYPFQIPKVSFDNPIVLISLAIHILLAVYALYSVYKNKSTIGYGILFYFITFSVVSQVFFTVGTTMNERFVFMPSLGIILALVIAITHLANSISKPIQYSVFVVVAIFSLLTVKRNPVWKSDTSLFLHDIAVSKNSAKLNMAVGGLLIDSAIVKTDTVERKKMLKQAIEHLKRAIEIYGDTTLLVDGNEVHIGDANAYNLLGNAYYFYNSDLVSAEKAYKMADYYSPGHFDSYQNLVTIFYNQGKYAESIPLLKALLNAQPTSASYHFKLGDAYKNIGAYDSAILAYIKSLDADPKGMAGAANYQIGLCYAKHKNDLNTGIIYLQKAQLANPNDLNFNEDLGVAYAFTGQPKLAIVYLRRCLAIKPGYTNAIQNLSLAYDNIGMKDSAAYFKSLLSSK